MEIRFNQASRPAGLAACRPRFECFDWLNASYDSPTTVPQGQIKISCLMFIILSIRQDQVGLCNTRTRT